MSKNRIGVSNTTYYGDAQNLTNIVDAAASTYGDASNIAQIVVDGNGRITSIINVPVQSGGGGGSGEFNTGLSNSFQSYPVSYETNIIEFPSTTGKRYIIESINVANVFAGDVPVNIILSITNQVEQTYIAYNVPIVSGGLVELLKQPIVANPSDVIKAWVTDSSYTGVSDAAEVYITYTESDDTDYFGVTASTVSLPTADLTTIYTSSGYPSVIQSIHLSNRTDGGDYPVSVVITNNSSVTYLAKDLIIPRYASVNILDRVKRIEQDSTISIKVEQTSTIDVIISGKKIT